MNNNFISLRSFNVLIYALYVLLIQQASHHSTSQSSLTHIKFEQMFKIWTNVQIWWLIRSWLKCVLTSVAFSFLADSRLLLTLVYSVYFCTPLQVLLYTKVLVYRRRYQYSLLLWVFSTTQEKKQKTKTGHKFPSYVYSSIDISKYES